MHKKYAAQGLEVISVSLDSLEGTAEEKRSTLERVTGFLRAQGADFTNVLLDETVEWPQKFHFVAPPCYFVFDKAGKWHQFKGEESAVDYQAMEKLVTELLKAR